MRRKPLESLGEMVRKRRGQRTLREVAKEIGISAATLLRVESGRIPDVATFGRICAWLGEDPAVFLGTPLASSTAPVGVAPESAIQIAAHFRADREPLPETLSALAKMLLIAARNQAQPTDATSDDHA